MVNLVSKTSEDKSFMTLLSKRSKKIRKTLSPSKESTKIGSPSSLNSVLQAQNSINYNSSLTDIKSSLYFDSCPSIEKPSTNMSNSYNILQPFCNLVLYPSSLQKIVVGSGKLSCNDIMEMIFQLKTPANLISFQKKIEKMKLLSMGQEITIQNYLKDKFAIMQKPEILQEYYRYLKSKLVLDKDMEENYRRRTNFNENYQNEKNLFDFAKDEENFQLKNYFVKNDQNSEKAPIYYKNYENAIENNVKVLYDNDYPYEEEIYFRENEKTFEEKASKNLNEMKSMIFCMNENQVYDEDKFLAKEEDYIKT